MLVGEESADVVEGRLPGLTVWFGDGLGRWAHQPLQLLLDLVVSQSVDEGVSYGTEEEDPPGGYLDVVERGVLDPDPQQVEEVDTPLGQPGQGVGQDQQEDGDGGFVAV